MLQSPDFLTELPESAPGFVFHLSADSAPLSFGESFWDDACAVPEGAKERKAGLLILSCLRITVTNQQVPPRHGLATQGIHADLTELMMVKA